MKNDIHPEYRKAAVVCVCGNTFETRSSMGNIHVEICSACHPYYTGKHKLLDSAVVLRDSTRSMRKRPRRLQHNTFIMLSYSKRNVSFEHSVFYFKSYEPQSSQRRALTETVFKI